jgi:two-component system, OmpR family, response regulator MprA
MALETRLRRILIADDEAMIREVAQRILKHAGYEVEVAVDGAEALEKVVADPTRYGLVILDGNMPRLSGREAALRIREVAPEIRLLLATGSFEPEDFQWFPQYGFNAVIAKPYSFDDLAKAVGDQFTGSEATGA